MLAYHGKLTGENKNRSEPAQIRDFALRNESRTIRYRSAAKEPSQKGGVRIGNAFRRDFIMTTNTASARYVGLGKDGKGSISTKSGVLTDQAYGFGTRFEGKPGTNPEELIAAAHAACFTMATSFALAAAGHSEGTLDTQCTVTLDKDGDGFAVTKSALTLNASIPGITPEDFARIADEAKAGCPISKLLNCEVTLEKSLGD